MGEYIEEETSVTLHAVTAAAAAHPPAPAGAEHARSQYTTLLATNPNYFGQLAGSGFEPELVKSYDTTYEDLCGVGYSPERRRLEATVVIKRATGYSGPLCWPGSREYVRFYVDYGAGWQDAGIAAAEVHDIPDGKDCAGSPEHPLSYVVGVPYDPPGKVCDSPQLPLVRAILSWQTAPPPAQPDWPPVWGTRHECHIQIPPRRPKLSDLVTWFKPKLTTDVTLPKWYGPAADAEIAALPPAARGIAKLRADYADVEVPPHRYGMVDIHPLLTSGNPELVAQKASGWQAAGIDWAAAVKALLATKGDVSYEELECVGLDNNTDMLVGTFRVKKPYGFSGGPCSAGSTEYVAFWADWGNSDCAYTYLGTVKVGTHDFSPVPAGGLCYSALLPVDLTNVRRGCDQPVIGRIRAVLSWNAPPSTTDPDAVPHWGNRVDVHVQVRPGDPVSGPHITVLGGVPTAKIEKFGPNIGMTAPDAAFQENGMPTDGLGRPCPFAGRVSVHGEGITPGLTLYRLLVRDVTQNTGFTPVTTKFWVTDFLGNPVPVTPGPDGWLIAPAQNSTHMLGWIDTSGDDLWEVRLELSSSLVTDTRPVQLDNTLRLAEDSGPADPDNTGDLHITSGGDCGKFTVGDTISGWFVARDRHFAGYSIDTVPFAAPAGQLNPSSGTTQTPTGGLTWSLDTAGMQPCGYVIELWVSDLAIVNSAYTGRARRVTRGFCLDA